MRGGLPRPQSRKVRNSSPPPRHARPRSASPNTRGNPCSGEVKKTRQDGGAVAVYRGGGLGEVKLQCLVA
ncbi:hypothetical protein BaRGS_00012595 [Batillaria attramentaria]|uniref:Uncharacterized protein n=1 Tax=Batillaria attramentaria TaxID=370345 RepID=A0ABD0LA19_9CAEN